jgi:phage gp29-like protein
MAPKDLESEWQKLCEAHKNAMDAYNNISSIVIPKMAAIAKGTSCDNPTYEEESKFDNAMEALKDVQFRMAEFIKNNGLKAK